MTERTDPSASDHARELLLAGFKYRRQLREERRDIGVELRDHAKTLRSQGFDPRRVDDVIRWLEECEKHGRDIVDEAEALFELYRGVADGGGKNLSEMMDDARDRALLAQFAGDTEAVARPESKKHKAASDALSMAEMNRMLRGGA